MKILILKWHELFNHKNQELLTNLGLLFVRLSVGLLMAFSHGIGKIQKYFAGGEIRFADPIGIGVEPSLFLAGMTEFFLSLALAIGFFTRIVSIPLAFTMLVAIFIVHVDDPFKKQEFAILYLIPFLMLMFTGPGKFSLDYYLKNKFNKI